jgi:hypothetical protein
MTMRVSLERLRLSMTDLEDLLFRLERAYNAQEERIKLIELVQKRQASNWWRFKNMMKGWYR